MHKRTKKYLNFVIDKLTNSIENTLSGEVFDTEIAQVTDKDIKAIKGKDWQFSWRSEFKDNSKQIFKLTTTNNPTIIQGLLSIEDKEDHIFMHLVESAKFNLGKHKLYLGVPGNLVAYACKVSFDRGYEGFVAFDSKTVLIEHYQKSLGATHLGGRRMYIDTKAAGRLISQYFKT
ncbi:MAG TPA: hypothetical protein VN026_00615 [Bacteroidia bacterium]|nr:hypothetical protein [Bacteroidia bacterium]